MDRALSLQGVFSSITLRSDQWSGRLLILTGLDTRVDVTRWKDLKSIGMVERDCIINGEVSVERRTLYRHLKTLILSGNRPLTS